MRGSAVSSNALREGRERAWTLRHSSISTNTAVSMPRRDTTCGPSRWPGIKQLTEARLGVLHGPDLHDQIHLMTSPMTSLRPGLLEHALFERLEQPITPHPVRAIIRPGCCSAG
jgi:hypothetical protein